MYRYGDEIYSRGQRFVRPEKPMSAEERQIKRIMNGYRDDVFLDRCRLETIDRRLSRFRQTGKLSRGDADSLLLRKAELEENIAGNERELDEWRSFYRDVRSHAQNPQWKYRKKYRKIPDSKAEERLLQYIREETARFLEMRAGRAYVSAEDASLACRIPKGQVSRLFHKLNLRGVLSRKKDRRDPDADWVSSVYYIRKA